MIKELTLHRAKEIPGWMFDAELQFLAETASKSKRIFEIGSFAGKSTRALADNTDGTVFAIDPWNHMNYNGHETAICIVTDAVVFNMFYCNLADHIKTGRVVPCVMKWEDFETDKKADFIFIDGNHKYNAVCHDIDKALKFLSPGGILAGHDYAVPWTGVIKAVSERFDDFKVVDSIWWVQR